MNDQKKSGQAELPAGKPAKDEADLAEAALGKNDPKPEPKPEPAPAQKPQQPQVPAQAQKPEQPRPQEKKEVPYKDLPRDKQIRRLLLGGTVPKMIEHAMPKGLEITPLNILWSAITTIEKPNPRTGECDLYRCSDMTILQAVFQAAELGLEFGGAQADCWLINYGNIATFQMAAYGYLTLAYRTGRIVRVWTDVIYEADKHQIVRGLQPTIIHDLTESAHLPHDNVDYDHKNFVPVENKGRGLPLFAYVCAEDREGRVHWDFITEDTAQRARSTSKAPNSNAYKIWPDEMRKRTAITRARKVWPRAELLALAMASDERGELSHKLSEMMEELKRSVVVPATGEAVAEASAQSRGLDNVLKRLNPPGMSARQILDASIDTSELVAAAPLTEEQKREMQGDPR